MKKISYSLFAVIVISSLALAGCGALATPTAQPTYTFEPTYPAQPTYTPRPSVTPVPPTARPAATPKPLTDIVKILGNNGFEVWTGTTNCKRPCTDYQNAFYPQLMARVFDDGEFVMLVPDHPETIAIAEQILSTAFGPKVAIYFNDTMPAAMASTPQQQHGVVDGYELIMDYAPKQGQIDANFGFEVQPFQAGDSTG